MRGIGALVALGSLGTALAGCANRDALALVRQACVHVEQSISLYSRSAATAPGPVRRQLAGDAEAQLRAALPLAAKAAGEDAQWQALSTTVAEISRVPEANLVPALEQQCADVRAGSRPGPPAQVTTSTELPTNPPPVGR